MLVGLQGAGKTTHAAKLALHLRKEGRNPLLVAADVYRPAAITQLQTLGKQINIPVYDEGTERQPGRHRRQRRSGSPASAATTRSSIDTAGRLQIDERMMQELADITRRASSPTEILLVADAMTGQEAVGVAAEFHDRLGVTGLILTKMDGDARGGAALSIRAVTGVPIKFIGTGEKLDALEPFYPRPPRRPHPRHGRRPHPDRARPGADRPRRRPQRAPGPDAQGPVRPGGLPRAAPEDQEDGAADPAPGDDPRPRRPVRQAKAQISDDDYKQIEAIIHSMTPVRAAQPATIIGRAAARRIARAAAPASKEVNQLLKQFREMQKMMEQFGKMAKKGKMPPGLPFDF